MFTNFVEWFTKMSISSYIDHQIDCPTVKYSHSIQGGSGTFVIDMTCDLQHEMRFLKLYPVTYTNSLRILVEIIHRIYNAYKYDIINYDIIVV